MGESKKQTVILTCSIIACVVTLITCGTLIGGMRTEVVHLQKDTSTIYIKLDSLAEKQGVMETKQAFLEGVMSTKLDNIKEQVQKLSQQMEGTKDEN